jgi:hypothetical protein
MKTTPRIGKVVAILSVKEDSDLMIITATARSFASIRARSAGRPVHAGRAPGAHGREGDQVAAAAEVLDKLKHVPQAL